MCIKLQINNIQHGFTFIEILIALLISAMLIAVGVPMMKDFVHNNQIKAITLDLTQSINLARSEALKRNADVTLAPKSSDWSNGWTIATSGDTIKHKDEIENLNITGPSSVTFSQNGRPKTSGTLIFIVDSNVLDYALMRCVSVSLGGRVSLMIDNDDNGDCYDG